MILTSLTSIDSEMNKYFKLIDMCGELRKILVCPFLSLSDIHFHTKSVFPAHIRVHSQLSTFLKVYREYAGGGGLGPHQLFPPKINTFFNHAFINVDNCERPLIYDLFLSSMPLIWSSTTRMQYNMQCSA